MRPLFNYTHHLITSGLEVIGGISAVITPFDASIKIYDSAQSDAKLSGTFEVVRRQLPVILHILRKRTIFSRLQVTLVNRSTVDIVFTTYDLF